MAVKLNTFRLSRRFAKTKLLASPNKYHDTDVHINVTALVDMMTVLVIFLLMQFSATGDMLFISKNLKMPSAEHGEAIVRAPIVSLDRLGGLYFEGQQILEGLAASDGKEWEIPQLKQRLLENKKRFEVLGGGQQTLAVNLQADREIEYAVLKRVLKTCESAGYAQIKLVENPLH